MGKTVWFKLRGNGQRCASSTAGSTFDTVVAIYDTANTPTEANRMACDDNGVAGSKSRRRSRPDVRGNIYMVQVGGKIAATCPSARTSARRSATLTVTAEAIRARTTTIRAAPLALPTGVPLGADNFGATPGRASGRPATARPTRRRSGSSGRRPTPGTRHVRCERLAGRNPVMRVLRASDGAVARLQ